MSNGQRPLQFCKEYLGLSVVLLVTNWTGLASFNSPDGVTSCDVVFNQRKRRERERERETERTAEKMFVFEFQLMGVHATITWCFEISFNPVFAVGQSPSFKSFSIDLAKFCYWDDGNWFDGLPFDCGKNLYLETVQLTYFGLKKEMLKSQLCSSQVVGNILRFEAVFNRFRFSR